MKMQTPEGEDCARHLAASLVRLTELDKTAPVDAKTLRTQLIAHVRSAWPQEYLELKEMP